MRNEIKINRNMKPRGIRHRKPCRIRMKNRIQHLSDGMTHDIHWCNGDAFVFSHSGIYLRLKRLSQWIWTNFQMCYDSQIDVFQSFTLFWCFVVDSMVRRNLFDSKLLVKHDCETLRSKYLRTLCKFYESSNCWNR